MIIIIIKILSVYYVVFTPVWWIAKDSLGIVALGIIHDVTHCFNLGNIAFLHANNCLLAF